MKVRYSRRAVADLIAIADYIREHSPRAAQAVEKKLRASIDQLEMSPFTGRATDDPSHTSRPPGAARSFEGALRLMQPTLPTRR